MGWVAPRLQSILHKLGDGHGTVHSSISQLAEHADATAAAKGRNFERPGVPSKD